MTKPGPKSLSDRTGEDTVTLKIMLTRSQHEFLMSQRLPAAAYMRNIINTVMLWRRAINDDPAIRDQLLALIEHKVSILAQSGELSPTVDWDHWLITFVELLRAFSSNQDQRTNDN